MEKLYKWSKNGMKMIIDSGFKTFDKQTNLIASGNCISNTQYSNYIRPWNETECNGTKFEEGHLFNFDLQHFHISSAMKDYIRSLNKQVCLYEFFIYNKNGKKDIIGWLIEDKNSVMNITVCQKYKVDYNKRYMALDLCKRIIEKERI